jgi:hypothetical protein
MIRRGMGEGSVWWAIGRRENGAVHFLKPLATMASPSKPDHFDDFASSSVSTARMALAVALCMSIAPVGKWVGRWWEENRYSPTRGLGEIVAMEPPEVKKMEKTISERGKAATAKLSNKDYELHLRWRMKTMLVTSYGIWKKEDIEKLSAAMDEGYMFVEFFNEHDRILGLANVDGKRFLSIPFVAPVFPWESELQQEMSRKEEAKYYKDLLFSEEVYRKVREVIDRQADKPNQCGVLKK